MAVNRLKTARMFVFELVGLVRDEDANAFKCGRPQVFGLFVVRDQDPAAGLRVKRFKGLVPVLDHVPRAHDQNFAPALAPALFDGRNDKRRRLPEPGLVRQQEGVTVDHGRGRLGLMGHEVQGWAPRRGPAAAP